MKWGEGVMDNEERDTIREAEALAKEQEDSSSEEEFTDEDTEEEDDEYDEYKEYIPQDVMMGYITSLSHYGYSDFFKLQTLHPVDWDNLKHNIGIAKEHEKHLMAALDIKRPKSKVRRVE